MCSGRSMFVMMRCSVNDWVSSCACESIDSQFDGASLQENDFVKCSFEPKVGWIIGVERI